MPQNSKFDRLHANPQLNELREKKIVAFEDGTLSIASKYSADSGVASLLAYCTRNDIPVEIVWVDVETINKINSSTQATSNTGSTSQAIQIFNEMISEAFAHKASDIHIIIQEHSTLIKNRIDGDLEVMKSFSLTRSDGLLLTSAIYTSLTDLSDPTYILSIQQDARVPNTKLPVAVRKSVSGLRIGTTPTEGGTLMVLRFLYEETDAQKLSDLGYSQEQEKIIKDMNRHPFGFNMIVGPTGSGKSTTLKIIMAMLSTIYGGRRNMMAVEDPSEFKMPDVNQVPITNAETEEERRTAFNNVLRACMRLDPDDIMVGEVRDKDTAAIIINAAMTGHRVLTTLHANTALIAVHRLLILGVAEDSLGDPGIFRGVIAQRLVKTLCTECRIPYNDVSRHPALAQYLEDSGMDARLQPILQAHAGTLYFKNGCSKCRNTGRAGRTLVAEIFENTPDNPTMPLMMERKWADARHMWLKSGGKSMMMHAVEKMMQGLIDPRAIEDAIDPIYLEKI